MRVNSLRPDDPIITLKGIGPKTAAAMAAEGVRTVADLLLHLPRRYEDRSRLTTLDSLLEPGMRVLVRGRIKSVRVRRIPRRRLHIVDGRVEDAHGSLKVVWFNQRWLARRLEKEPELFLYGQIREARGGGIELLNPEIEKAAEDVEGIVPIYPTLARFGGRRLRKLIKQCLPAIEHCGDPLSEREGRPGDLPDLQSSLRELHAPTLPRTISQRDKLLTELNHRRSPFHRRLSFDELLAFACSMADSRERRTNASAPRLTQGADVLDRASDLLPFELTGAQSRVLEEIMGDFEKGRAMARLVQGDVGSGKTAVAALTMLMVLEGGYQVAIMAPTELLAEQHARTLAEILTGAGYPPSLLVASLPAADRREVRRRLAEGSVGLVVGTHALFQESVKYRRLGLVVVDEQHRFGVVQRTTLLEKGHSPHLLVMTATPIPRSLALTVYGDLDLSIIDELPPGRRPVRTVLRSSDARPQVFEFLRKEISEGGRVFVVYPLIDASEEIRAAALAEHEDEVRTLLPDVEMGILHGRLSRPDREEVAARFRDGSVQVLLATTVVEVGVDVPEATVMVIESAQRFGLSQLHQLRGRVGRGWRPAWCILFADEPLGDDARQRLDVVCKSNDGFEIAESDLEMRGPGELTGTRQWGPAGFRFANLIRDIDLIVESRNLAATLGETGELPRVRKRLARYHHVQPLHSS